NSLRPTKAAPTTNVATVAASSPAISVRVVGARSGRSATVTDPDAGSRCRRARSEPRQAVDAARVLGVVVLGQSVGAAPLGPVEQRVALALVGQERDAVPARVADALELAPDDGPGAGQGGEPRRQLGEAGVVGGDGLAPAEEAQDA